MTPRSSILKAYRLLTAPIRGWSRWHLRRCARVPVTGLFFHRVADDQPNDWTITTDQFDKMLAWLQKNVDLVSMEEAQNRMRHGNNGRIAVNISFDDGYADNCLHAVPTLISKRIPFTYYVTTHNVRHGNPFPHDVRLEQPLAPNSSDEIRAMADAGVEIGVHTRTHRDLGRVTEQRDLESEIRGAREDLAAWIGYKPRHFAFPFGLQANVSPRLIQYVHDEGFDSYCTAFGGYNFPMLDTPFHLRRFHGDPVLERVKNWLSLDPRWVHARPNFEYIPFRRPNRRKLSAAKTR